MPPVGGVAEVNVHSHTGFAIDGRDLGALQHALRLLHRNSSLYARMAAAARQRAAVFGPERFAEQVLAVLRPLLPAPALPAAPRSRPPQLNTGSRTLLNRFSFNLLPLLPTAFLLHVYCQKSRHYRHCGAAGIEWRRDKWNRCAKWFLRWSENLAVKYSHADISDNDATQNYTARAYSTRSRVIEYGGDHAQPQPLTDAHRQKYPFLAWPYAFKVCRIEPENNVHLVLRAFAELPSYPFVVVVMCSIRTQHRKMLSVAGQRAGAPKLATY